MGEPYNATRFRTHLGECKARGEKQNLPITNFKPKDKSGANPPAKPKIISGRKQIFVGMGTFPSPLIKRSSPDNGVTFQSRPCHGMSGIHSALISTYISRTVVEGAGSVSLQRAAQMGYGEKAEYSKLTSNQKKAVVIAQSYLRSWSMNRELRVAPFTDREKIFKQDQSSMTIWAGAKRCFTQMHSNERCVSNQSHWKG